MGNGVKIHGQGVQPPMPYTYPGLSNANYNYAPANFGPSAFCGSMMFRGFQSPMDQMQAKFYHHEATTKGMLRGGVAGGLSTMAAGAAVGAFIGFGVPGAIIGGGIGLIVGLLGGGAAGRGLSSIQAVHHDAEDDGVLNGSPLYSHA